MKKTTIAFIIISVLCFVHHAGWTFAQKPLSSSRPKEEAIQMKVNFYVLDREKVNKGDFLGTATLKEDGNLLIDVTDQKLEEILNSPYTTMTGGIKDGVAYDGLITYQPGTLKHLQAIAIECYRFGYIGQIVEQ